jgi:hypothetical protein
MALREIPVLCGRNILSKLGLTLSQGLLFPFPKRKLPLRSFGEMGISISP